MSGGTEGKEENGLDPETKPEESDSLPEPKPQGELKPPGIVIDPDRALRVKNARVTSLDMTWPPLNNKEYYYDVDGCPVCNYFGKGLCGSGGCTYSHLKAYPGGDQIKLNSIQAPKKGDQTLQHLTEDINERLNEVEEMLSTITAQTTTKPQPPRIRLKRIKQRDEQGNSKEEDAAKRSPRQLTSNFLKTLQLAALLFRAQGRQNEALRLYADAFHVDPEFTFEDLMQLFNTTEPMTNAVAVFQKSHGLIRQSHLDFKADTTINRAFATTLYLALWFGGDRQLIIQYFINARGGNGGLKSGAYTAEKFLDMTRYNDVIACSLSIFEVIRTDIIRRTGTKLQDSSDSETRVEADGGSTKVTFKNSTAKNSLPKDIIGKLFQTSTETKDKEMEVALQMPERPETTMCVFGLREGDGDSAIVGTDFMKARDAMCVTSGDHLYISVKLNSEVNATFIASLMLNQGTAVRNFRPSRQRQQQLGLSTRDSSQMEPRTSMPKTTETFCKKVAQVACAIHANRSACPRSTGRSFEARRSLEARRSFETRRSFEDRRSFIAFETQGNFIAFETGPRTLLHKTISYNTRKSYARRTVGYRGRQCIRTQ